MSEPRHPAPPAPIAERVRALEEALSAKRLVPDGFLEDVVARAEDAFRPENGARIVARAWVDPAYRARLLADGAAASRELGIGNPFSGSDVLVVLENTPSLHNVIVCTQCSCTAWSVLGLPPDWYKSPEYRARIVREPRAVLREMGLDLPEGVAVRVWDTSADTRYMVLPLRPPETEGWSEERLAAVVTRESMIGVARIDVPG
jgi:nitrile hydratase subunit alpha